MWGVKDKTKPIRVTFQAHGMARLRAAELGMTIQEVADYAIRNGMPTKKPQSKK